MKTITVGQLRQNPTQMLADVAAGETYRITRHDHEVGRIVPPTTGGVAVTPAKHRGAIVLPGLPDSYQRRTVADLDALLTQLREDR